MEEKQTESIKLYLAPLQGYTNSDYRTLHHKYFGGIDKYYSPYLRFEPHKEFKKSVWKDLQIENNKGVNFVPQVLGTDSTIFIDLARQLQDFGYGELNWNLGCPYPMVTKRGLGSALILKPDVVRRILDNVLPKIDISLSIKTRLGFDNSEEIYPLLDVLNQYSIKELTIHTRTAKQMYKGKASPKSFIPLINRSKNPLVYNGDILSVDDEENCRLLFDNKISAYMIGRGVLMNPFLASEIKGKIYSDKEKREILRNFHYDLFELNKQKLQPSHLLSRMQTHWEYLSYSLENQHKAFKLIKKAKRIDKYLTIVDDLLK